MEENLTQKFQDVRDAITHNDSRLDDLETKTDRRFKEMMDRMDSYEFHDRKYNLLFFGLKIGADCEMTVREFLREDLELGDGMARLDLGPNLAAPTAFENRARRQQVRFLGYERSLGVGELVRLAASHASAFDSSA